MENRYGGYWRFPQIVDFCYLVNPFFPPAKLEDELKSNFGVLNLYLKNLSKTKTFKLTS